MPTVQHVIAALRELRERADLDHALEALTKRHRRGELITLYQRWFPRQYRRSTALCYAWCLESETSFTAPTSPGREDEFAVLVDRHLFPLANTEAAEILDYYYPLIPVAFCGYSSDAELSEEPLPIQILASLVDGYEDVPAWETLQANLLPGTPAPLTLTPPASAPRWTCDGARLSRLCRRHGGVLALLPSALAVMAHDTGTIFLDLDPESGFENDYVWCDDHLRDLRDQWTRAKRFLDGLTRFTKALTQRPRLWIDVLTVWNRCCAPAMERTSR